MKVTKPRLAFSSVVPLALLLAMTSHAIASSTWYADGVNGSDSNDCKSAQTACKTIGHAISLAASGDAIMVVAATYRENLSIGLSLNIVGTGYGAAIIDGGAVNSVVKISSRNAQVNFSKLTIRNGFAGFGGGIYNLGTLTLRNSMVSGNTASGAGFQVTGGGIENLGTLTISNSTVSGNTATNKGVGDKSSFGARSASGHRFIQQISETEGGGIHNQGTLTVTNSTVSGNSSIGAGVSHGGGVANSGSMTINNSTIAGNSVTGINGGDGGGIYNATTAMVQNSIVANNSSGGGNCNGGITSNGYNLSSDGSCSFNHTGDLNSIDPKLGPLRNNGGPTPTMALLAGSPAIDGGNPSGCSDSGGHLLNTDQRGAPRPDKQHGVCDIGAYEQQNP